MLNEHALLGLPAHPLRRRLGNDPVRMVLLYLLELIVKRIVFIIGYLRLVLIVVTLRMVVQRLDEIQVLLLLIALHIKKTYLIHTEVSFFFCVAKYSTGRIASTENTIPHAIPGMPASPSNGVITSISLYLVM